MSAFVEHQLALEADFGSNEHDDIKANLMRSHLEKVNRFQREYRECTVELRRRYLASIIVVRRRTRAAICEPITAVRYRQFILADFAPRFGWRPNVVAYDFIECPANRTGIE